MTEEKVEKRFEIKEAISFGWESLWKNVWFWISLVLIAGVLSWLRDLIAADITSDSAKTILEIIYYLVSSAISLAILKVILNYVDKKVADYSALRFDFKTYVNYVLATIIYTFIVVVGFLLLIVPGVIWAIQFQFYGYLIIDEGLTPIAALKRSLEITRGERGHLFVYGLILVGIMILGVLALVVGLLFAVPIVWLATAFIYRHLKSSHQPGKAKK